MIPQFFFTVPNSPRIGLNSEAYGQIIITNNDDAAGILQLSPLTLSVTEETEVPQLFVVRSGGSFGEVRLSSLISQSFLSYTYTSFP